MDIFSKSVMMKGKDYTDKVTSIELQYPYVKITLSNGQEYTPKCENTYIADLRGNVDLNGKIVIYNPSPLLDVVHLLDFGKLYRVIFKGRKSKIYTRESIRIENDLQKKYRELFFWGGYWCDITQHVKIGQSDGEKGDTFVAKAFASISCIHPESALAQYMNGTYEQIDLEEIPLIFPFDFNQSQQDAIIQALCNCF